MHSRPPTDSSNFRIGYKQIEAARRGSLQLRFELLARYRYYMLTVAREVLDRDLRTLVAESDLVEESIINAAEKFDQFEGTDEKALFGWLTGFMHNQLMKEVRKYKKTKKRALHRNIPLYGNGQLLNQLYDSGSTPSAYLIAQEEEQRVHRLLAQLSEQARQVIYLRMWELLTFAEIGQRLDISEDAACKRFGRTIKLLKTLARQGPETS